ncbi:hypothetical protein ACET3Z_030808 [Daucus carota]
MYVDAVGVFKEVLGGEFVPNEVTVSSVLSACGNMGGLDFGRQDKKNNSGKKQQRGEVIDKDNDSCIETDTLPLQIL